MLCARLCSHTLSACLPPPLLFSLRGVLVALASAGLHALAVCCASPSLLHVATVLACAAALSALSRVAAVESLLLLPHLGLQLETRECGGRVRRRFVAAERVLAVAVNENVSTTRVHFYLLIAVRGESRLLLPFAELLPRLPELTIIYRELLEKLPSSPTWPHS